MTAMYVPPALREAQAKGANIGTFVAKTYGVQANEAQAPPKARDSPREEFRGKQQSFTQHSQSSRQPSSSFECRDISRAAEKMQSFFSTNSVVSCPGEFVLFSEENMPQANYEAYRDTQVETTFDKEPLDNFQQLDISKQLKENIQRCNFQEPTPVQRYAILPGLQKNDVLVQANTGSGKTAAFAIPCVQNLLSDRSRVRSQKSPANPGMLVILPTRELAQQTIFNFYRLIHKTNLRACVLYGGGEDTGAMRQELKHGCDILIGCPGKLIDFYEKKAFTLQQCQMLVIDEADKCLDMGFEPQMRQIIEKLDLPKERQTLLFSATFTASVQGLIRDFTRNPIRIKVGQPATCQQIKQSLINVPEQQKLQRLFSIIDETPEDQKIIVFCETKVRTNELGVEIRAEGRSCETLHGDMEQNERSAALKAFKDKSRLLVATDCAQRGLDIQNVGVVINYDCPHNAEDYIHRVGRTGRVGKEGTAITFVNSNTPSNVLRDLIKEIEKVGQHVPEDILRITGGRASYGRQSGGHNGGSGFSRGRAQQGQSMPRERQREFNSKRQFSEPKNQQTSAAPAQAPAPRPPPKVMVEDENIWDE